VEANTGQGVGGAHEPAGPVEDGSSPGRSGLARWPGPARWSGLAGLKSDEKIFSE
jgi:hypothetical protein